MKPYRDGKLVDEVLVENVGRGYGEYDIEIGSDGLISPDLPHHRAYRSVHGGSIA